MTSTKPKPVVRTSPRPMRPRRRGCSYALCLMLSIVLTALLAWLWAVQTWFAESAPWCYIATYSPQVFLLIPPLAVGLLCLVTRHRRLLLYHAVLTLAVALVFVRPAWPHLPARHRPADRVRIVTWNVHEEFTRVRELAKVLEPLEADIVCLQEARRPAFENVVPGAMAAHTREVTTLTRGRILSARRIRLGKRPNFRHGLETVIELPQGRLTVLNVHLMAVQMPMTVAQRRYGSPTLYETTRRARSLSLAVITDWLQQATGPGILTGDFNTPPNAPEYRTLERYARNAFLEGWGFGFTFHRKLPLIRIDHIWCLGGVRAVRCFTVPTEVSDHLPLAADIILPAPAEPAGAEGGD